MRRLSFPLASLAVLLVAVMAAPAASAGPVAGAARTCSLKGHYRSLGTSYVYRLRVTGISCKAGRSNISAYNSCRRRNGGARGRCGRVRGYSCSESRRSSRFQFDASATCRNGGRRFSFGYTQNV